METIKLLKIAPLERPELIEVEHTLEKLQELVGGTVQAVYPWEEPVAILCDDDGKAKSYPPNRILADEDGEPYDILVGTFYICGLTTDNFASISDELAEKFSRLFQYPEMFMRTMNGNVIMFRMGSGEEPRVLF